MTSSRMLCAGVGALLSLLSSPLMAGVPDPGGSDSLRFPAPALNQQHYRVGPEDVLRVRVARHEELGGEVVVLQDGRVVLPSLRPSPPDAPPPPEPPPDTEPAEPWNVAVDRALLSEGSVTLKDHVTTPPTTVTLGLPALELVGFSLETGPDARPGHGVIEARFRDGRARIKTSVATRKEGFSYGARLDVDNLPLDQTHVHVPQLRWTNLRGRLDARSIWVAEAERARREVQRAAVA